MKHRHLLLTLAVLVLSAMQLMAQVVPVRLSNVVQKRNGKDYYVHVAQQGQTVFSIARAYGLHYSVAVLRTDVQSMQAGDTVWLPVNDQSRAAVVFACGSAQAVEQSETIAITVSQGQTLYSISKAYNTTVERLQDLNPELKDGGLKAGQTIQVPATKEAKASAEKASAKKTTATAATTPAPKQETKKVEPAKPIVPLEPRERISGEKVYVSVMMPLYLHKMEEISTTKFDVDQRRKQNYPSFEFIQFYEGLQLALEDLENQGISVVLNVVDVFSEADSAVVNAFDRHNVAQSDFVIGMLTRKPFAKLAQLALQNRVFVINPLSTREGLVDGNPYIIRYMPSAKAVAKSMVDIVSASPNSNLYVIHSNGKEEQAMYNALQEQLEGRNDIKTTYFNWSQNAKLASTLKTTDNNVLISIYDQGKDKNRIQVSMLLSRLSAMTKGRPTLMTKDNYVRDLSDVDYQQLQNLNYTMLYTAYLDYNDPIHSSFIDRYKNRYKTAPQGMYAGMAHDILLYFSHAISKKGSQFWKSPSIPKPAGMLFPLHIQQKAAGSGFENQTAVFYRMNNLKLVKAESNK